jgi:maleylpyruvate isomerase
MGAPIGAIAGCALAHRSLSAALEGLDDPVARSPSRLPGWSVGHVLTHIARNADSVVRRLQGAAVGEVVDQYPGGVGGRAADIEAGAQRSAEELVADVRRTSAQVEEIFDALDDDAWARACRDVHGAEAPAHTVVFTRWREVEVHHVDLGLGYDPGQWPAALIEAWLPTELAQLGGRADAAALLGWLIGRGEAPGLSSWTGRPVPGTEGAP